MSEYTLIATTLPQPDLEAVRADRGSFVPISWPYVDARAHEFAIALRAL